MYKVIRWSNDGVLWTGDDLGEARAQLNRWTMILGPSDKVLLKVKETQWKMK